VIYCWCMLFVGDGVRNQLRRVIRENVGTREETMDVWKLI
jgi:hypothetical protein